MKVSNQGILGVIMRKHIIRFTAVALFALPGLPHALAVSKEMVQLETQVQQLQDMVQHLQTSNDERMGVIVNMVQQNNENMNRMMASVNALQTTLRTESDQRGSSNTQLSTQIQSLNDSVDELKTRIANLTTQMQSIQGQLGNVNGMPAQPGGGPAPLANQGPGGQAAAQPEAPPTPAAPPVDQIYQSALRDYNSAKYNIAASEFSDVIHYYPQDPLAGNAQFYLGEISYRQGKYAAAIKSYDALLEQYSGNSKAPAAELRKGQSLIEMGQKDAGIRELRTLVQRYPQTPEAQEGRSKLNGMGVRIYASKPSAYPQPAPN
jgi:tol-pal system protein YbgF